MIPERSAVPIPQREPATQPGDSYDPVWQEILRISGGNAEMANRLLEHILGLRRPTPVDVPAVGGGNFPDSPANYPPRLPAYTGKPAPAGGPGAEPQMPYPKGGGVPMPAAPGPDPGGPPGRLSDEYVRPPGPVTRSSGGGGGGAPAPTRGMDSVAQPMPAPAQNDTDGGIWAALRAAFADNAGVNQKRALERMIAGNQEPQPPQTGFLAGRPRRPTA